MTADLELKIDYEPTIDARTKIDADDKLELDRFAARTGRTEAQVLRLVVHAWANKQREAASS